MVFIVSLRDIDNHTLPGTGHQNAIGILQIKLRLIFAYEPPRDCRRPFGLSYAAMAGSSSMA
jgi:hypothetical protein